MKQVSIIIPTVEGREDNLARAVRGYEQRSCAHGGLVLDFVIQEGFPTCGAAWQDGIDQALGDCILFTADDLVPGENWLPPMLEAVDRGNVPVPLIVTPTPDVLDENHFPLPGNPLSSDSNFFECKGGPEKYPDWYEAIGQNEYPSVPFFSRHQWEAIGPMIIAQYGGDRWFGKKALDAGFTPVVRHGSIFYHYSAQPGRIPKAEGWMHVDRITFDLNIAYPAYESGELHPLSFHPEYDTPAGRKMARDWYEQRLPGPYPWDNPEEERYR